LNERPYADAEGIITEVEQRGGKSKHFDEDLERILKKHSELYSVH